MVPDREGGEVEAKERTRKKLANEIWQENHRNRQQQREIPSLWGQGTESILNLEKEDADRELSNRVLKREVPQRRGMTEIPLLKKTQLREDLETN